MAVTIDIVIPSYRVNEAFILPVLDLSVPEGAVVRFYLVIDQPDLTIPKSVLQRADQQTVFCYQNPVNMGAALSRNKGMDMGDGDWILFLDDDIYVPPDLLFHYKEAIDKNPTEMGFIGLVNFPPASNDFTRAVVASGSMDIFAIALSKAEHAWGATANMMVSRKAVADVRFSEMYPKAGGGEDVDFFLRMRRNNQYRSFKTLPRAAVEHPWWKGRAADYQRPFRYGRGNTVLAIRNPEYVYRDLFNTVELGLILLILIPVFVLIHLTWALALLLILAGIIIIDFLATAVQVLKRTGEFNPRVLYYTSMIRLAFQSGVLAENIRRGRVNGITERFNDSGSLRKNHFFRFNSYKIVKWLLYPVLGWVIWQLFS